MEAQSDNTWEKKDTRKANNADFWKKGCKTQQTMTTSSSSDEIYVIFGSIIFCYCWY